MFCTVSFFNFFIIIFCVSLNLIYLKYFMFYFVLIFYDFNVVCFCFIFVCFCLFLWFYWFLSVFSVFLFFVWLWFLFWVIYLNVWSNVVMYVGWRNGKSCRTIQGPIKREQTKNTDPDHGERKMRTRPLRPTKPILLKYIPPPKKIKR